jgi:hypothetical protein
LNINRRGELWINTKEKPRPVFRPVKAARIEIEPPAAKDEGRRAAEAKPAGVEGGADTAEVKAEEPGQSEGAEPPKPKSESSRAPGAPLPEGVALLDKIRPHMRRNRRGPGGSGSTSFLSRALRTNEADLKSAFVALGLTLPATANDKPVYTEIGEEVWWLNLDSRGGLWINGREKEAGETAASREAESTQVATTPTETTPGETTASAPADAPVSGDPTDAAAVAVAAPATETALPTAIEGAAVPASEPAPAPVPAASDSPLAAVRPLLKEAKTGAFAAKVDDVAGELGKSADDLLAMLAGTGLKVPEKARERPVYTEHAGERLWLSRNAKGELWINAKAARTSDEDDVEGEGDAEKSRRGGRSRGKKSAE